jgi:hypothetical protein
MEMETETPGTFRAAVIAALTNPQITEVSRLLLDGMYERGMAWDEAAADIDRNVDHYAAQDLIVLASWHVMLLAAIIAARHQWVGPVPPLHDMGRMHAQDVEQLRALHAVSESDQTDFGAAVALYVRRCQQADSTS